MIADALLSALESLVLFFMRTVDMWVSGPPGWLDDGIGAVSTIMSYTWGFSYWVPFEWFVPVMATVIGFRSGGLIIMIAKTLFNLLRGSGA